MGKLLSCPFCRELFSQGEAKVCPECGLSLVALSKLPLSLDGQEEARLRGELDPPEDQKLPSLYLGRGRGLLCALAVGGLFLFFQPWASILRPSAIALSGFDLARANAPWLWGGAIGWFLMVPLVWSRRTVHQMRGVRAIATFFALMTGGETCLLLLSPPTDHAFFSSGLSYEWGLYLSGALSFVASLVCVRFGGSDRDFRDLPLNLPPLRVDQNEARH